MVHFVGLCCIILLQCTVQEKTLKHISGTSKDPRNGLEIFGNVMT
jgi:hypothetical protein